MQKKPTALIALLLSILLLAACAPLPALEGPLATASASLSASEADHAAPIAPSASQAWLLEGERPYSAWAVYWSTEDVMDELSPIADRLGILSYFEAYFLADGSLFLPEETTLLYQAVEARFEGNRWKSYLTFVNDLKLEDDTFSLKDVGLLDPLFQSEQAMDAHIRALVSFTLEQGFDGMEIDYEALRKSPSLYEPFTRFLSRLYDACEAEKLGLRVILEPSVPCEEYAFPQGPEYVLMCYNLHGGHSDPGPKADYEFFDELMEKSAYLPGTAVFALASGGYDWGEDGDAVQRTLAQACKLFDERGKGSMIRDAASGTLAFRYTDEGGALHTVWCADLHTLALWTQYFKKAGHERLAYWRLGGNFAQTP